MLTIDDGYADNLTIALPLLARHRFAATVFLVSRKLGSENDWTSRDEARRPLLSAEQAEQLASAAEIAIGAHTRTHPRLTEVEGERRAEEIGGAGEDLAALLGQPIPTFAYPYGKFDPAVVAAVPREAGYTGACTVESRAWPRPRRRPAAESPASEIRGADTLSPPSSASSGSAAPRRISARRAASPAPAGVRGSPCRKAVGWPL